MATKNNFLFSLIMSFFIASTVNVKNVYALDPISWFLIGSGLVHGGALLLGFHDDPVEAGASPSTPPPLQVRLAPLSPEQQALVDNPELQPDPISATSSVLISGGVIPSISGGTFTVAGDDAATVCQNIIKAQGYEDWNPSCPEAFITDDIAFSGDFVCGGCTITRPTDFRVFSPINVSGNVTTTDYNCKPGYTINQTTGTCDVDPLVPDNMANMIRDPATNGIVQDPRDPDAFPNDIAKDTDGTLSKIAPLADGGTVYSEIAPDTATGGSTVTNLQRDVPVTKQDNTTTTATITDTTVLDSAANVVSQTHTIVYADGTTPSAGDSINTGTASGTVNIDESGTPSSSGYGNADLTGIDGEIEGYKLAPDVDGLQVPAFSPTWSVGATCSPTQYSFSYLGYSAGFDLCDFLTPLQSILYWFFAVMTAIFVLHSWSSLNR